MCEVASFKNFENSLTTVKVMTKTKVAPFYLGHGVDECGQRVFNVCIQISLISTKYLRVCLFCQWFISS